MHNKKRKHDKRYKDIHTQKHTQQNNKTKNMKTRTHNKNIQKNSK